jgi:hypothetical protein
MPMRPLADTLLEVVDAVRPPDASGLVITDADIELPLELSAVVHDHKVLVAGSAPHTRWRTGVLPPVHLTRLHVVLVDAGAEIADVATEVGRAE